MAPNYEAASRRNILNTLIEVEASPSAEEECGDFSCVKDPQKLRYAPLRALVGAKW
jgi:hypothetical protein